MERKKKQKFEGEVKAEESSFSYWEGRRRAEVASKPANSDLI
jgi:hypothetical protein